MIRYAGLVLTSLLLAPGIAGASVTRNAPHQALAQGNGWMVPDANPKHPWLYVASFEGSFGSTTRDNYVSIFDMGRVGFPRIGQITQGLNAPSGIALDSAGMLYVPNFNAGNVMIYPPGATQPSLTLSQGLVNPASAAVEASGSVYVLNRGGSVSDIVVYPAGQTIPSEIITNSLIQVPGQCFFDSSGNLYVSDNSTGIYVIPPGSQQPNSLNLQGLSGPSGLALDPLNGNLFVGNLNAGHKKGSSVVLYRAGSQSPAYSLPNTLFADFLGIGVIGRTEYLMVSASQGNTVTFFKDNSRAASFALIVPAVALYGVAMKPAGAP